MVTLRVSTPVGPISVVGEIVAADESRWSVRRRDGSVDEIDVAAIEAAREVPPGRSREADPLEVEQVAAMGWRAPETVRLGDWLLRAAGGFTGRANSALAVGDPGRPLEAALELVAQWYAERGLPPRIQQPDGVPGPATPQALEQAGWTHSSAVHLMTGEIAHALHGMPNVVERVTAAGLELRTADQPDDGWLACYRQASGPLPGIAREVISNHPAAVYVSFRDDSGCAVGIARAAVDARWAGLFAVEVAPDRRREGLGAAVSLAALKAAARRRGRHVYLQVAADNHAAIALYERLNLRVHHDYRYWTPRDIDNGYQ
jgi:GNAT superfamily N-acetyltransferase